MSDFIGEVKGSVTYRVNRECKPRKRLKWQEGYGVLTVREGEVDKLCKYVDNQEEQHRLRKLSRVLEVLQAT